VRLLFLIVGLLLALVALGAEGAMKAGPNMLGPGHHRLKGASVETTPPPLDGFTTPNTAVSFRKLRSAYAGAAMKLRRTTGGTQDIAYLGSTGFTGAPWDEAAAAAFCAATTCFLDTWYNQGSGANLVQATAANQPALIFACNGSLPCFRMTAGTAQTAATAAAVTPATGVVTLSFVGARTAGTGICGFLRQNGTAAVNRLVGGTAGAWQVAATGSISRAAADAQWHAGLGLINGVGSILNIDGGESGGTVTGGTAAGVTGTAGAGTTTCEVGELLVWDAYAMPPAERSGLVTNQKTFFGTP
jgi:hypothetical protein